MSDKFIDNACKAFVTLTVGIGTWDGVAKLKDAGAKAAQDAGANSESARMYVDLLGRHQGDLKQVKRLFAAIRTYLYANTLPYTVSGEGQRRGPRLVPVVRVPEIYGKLKEMESEADDALHDFLSDYERLREIALNEDMGAWGQELRSRNKYPEVAEIERRFYVEVGAPRPLPDNAEAIRNMGLPMGMAEQFAEAHAADLQDQLASAKDAAVEAALESMKAVEKQLSNGERLHASLITNAKRDARMLRDMVAGYDNDPRLIAVADRIDERIANISDTRVWKTNATAREESLETAKAMRQSLEAYLKAQQAPAQAPAKPAVQVGPTMGKIKAGGIVRKSK